MGGLISSGAVERNSGRGVSVPGAVVSRRDAANGAYCSISFAARAAGRDLR